MKTCLDAECNSFTSSSSSESSDEGQHFEGPEKNLEIDFTIDLENPRGCRALTRNQLVAILAAAKCQILSSVSNTYLDSYVLSESSLFVYPHKMILKTCGTTTLLKCLPVILELTSALGLKIEWLSYSRKNFSLPQDQSYPHTSFDTEVEYLERNLPGHAEYGSAHVIGPVTSDHWLVYVWDDCQKAMELAQDRTLHVLMQDLDESIAHQFYAKTSHEMTRNSGIENLCRGSKLDDWAFTPCGYSMNAIDGDAYQTIHITPESHCSYASWETNARPSSYHKWIALVLDIFKPKRFTMTLFADRGGLDAMIENPLDIQLESTNYKRLNKSQTTFEGDYLCFVGNWKRKDLSSS